MIIIAESEATNQPSEHLRPTAEKVRPELDGRLLR